MSGRILIKDAARRDMMELAGFIAMDTAENAGRFLRRTREAIEWLATTPRAGIPLRSRLPRLAGVRRWPISGHPHYLVIYREIDGGIEVARVFHGASNWRDRLRRESKTE